MESLKDCTLICMYAYPQYEESSTRVDNNTTFKFDKP